MLRSRAGLALLALALVVRLGALAVTPDYAPQHDDRSYLNYAVAIAETGDLPFAIREGRIVPRSYRAPGFPAFLAATRLVAGTGLDALRLAQVLCGVALVALCGLLAAELWGRRAGLVTLGLAAVSPPLVLFGASLVSEPLYAALTTGAVLCALRARRSSSRAVPWAAGAGVAGGLATLVRPSGLVVLLPLALLAAPRLRWRPALAVLLAGAAAIAPWTARNLRVLDTFVLVNTQAGNTLAGTYNAVSQHDRAYPWRWRDPYNNGLYAREIAANRFDPPATDRALQRAVLAWLRDNPSAPLGVAWHDGLRIAGWAPRDWSRFSLHMATIRRSVVLEETLRAGLLAATLLGLAGVLARRARGAPAAWWLSGAAVAATAVLVNGEQRFAVPLQPWLLAVGGALLATLPRPPGPP